MLGKEEPINKVKNLVLIILFYVIEFFILFYGNNFVTQAQQQTCYENSLESLKLRYSTFKKEKEKEKEEKRKRKRNATPRSKQKAVMSSCPGPVIPRL